MNSGEGKNKLQGEALYSLRDMLVKNKILTDLNIAGNRIGLFGIKTIAEAFLRLERDNSSSHKISPLISLNLGSNDLNDELCYEPLKLILAKAKHLKILTLAHNKIGDLGMEEVF